MPKPTTIVYGLCHEGLTFFELPQTKVIRLKNDSVTGGIMTVHQLQKELQWIVPGDHGG
jgi:hypothetical protein